MNLREYNLQQAAQSEAMADALDTYLAASAAYRAECLSESNRPDGVAPDLAAMGLTAYRRNQAAYSLAARMQDLAGVTFDIEKVSA